MAKTKARSLGTAGATLLRRGHDALAAATLDTPAPKPRAAGGFKVITARLRMEDYRWLRQRAHEISMETGLRADASAVLRTLIEKARKG